ncbi:hypothetical protein AAFF_G00209840 [Aldrovandia affinis]|uniref:Uncharacterized protein n=1 Tax=Aldrovandia affinis TaxID=143900 RepID=A0AAD7SWH8_9TELE|nr:hypothetical protein AAFF_G00209840 [Aldrovandia affinis]
MTANSTSLEVIEDVFLTVWPFVRYVLLLLMLTAFAGTLMTDYITRGNSNSQGNRNEPKGNCQETNTWKDKSSRISIVSEVYYESI